MTTYLILAKILDPALFRDYVAGHLPSIAAYGGKVIFRSTANTTVHGDASYDAIAVQHWPDAAAFERWWQSPEYRPWAEIRDRAAQITIVRCDGPLA